MFLQFDAAHDSLGEAVRGLAHAVLGPEPPLQVLSIVSAGAHKVKLRFGEGTGNGRPVLHPQLAFLFESRPGAVKTDADGHRIGLSDAGDFVHGETVGVMEPKELVVSGLEFACQTPNRLASGVGFRRGGLRQGFVEEIDGFVGFPAAEVVDGGVAGDGVDPSGEAGAAIKRI